MTEQRALYKTASNGGKSSSPEPLDDYKFAIGVRRLLLSIATLIERRYRNSVLLIILKGKAKK